MTRDMTPFITVQRQWTEHRRIYISSPSPCDIRVNDTPFNLSPLCNHNKDINRFSNNSVIKMFSERSFQAQIIQEDLQRTPRVHFATPPKTKKPYQVLADKAKRYLVLFLETSSIHGLNHLISSKRHFLEVIIWLVIIGLSVFGSFYLSQITWSRYQSSPTVISMDRDMFAWNTTFPCVTVCPTDILDRKKLQVYLRLRNSKEENKTLLENFITQLSTTNYKNFEDVPDYSGIPPEKYLQLLLNLSAPFKPTLTIGVPNMALTIIPTITEIGLCYAINSITAEYNSPEYREANRWDILKNEKKSLFIHPLDGEVFAQVMNISTAYNVYIHSPQEVPDISTKVQYSNVSYYMKLYVTAVTVYTSKPFFLNIKCMDIILRLSINQRGCRFPHENNLKHNSIYTYTMCRMECRIRLCLKFCHCVPHFYRTIGKNYIIIDILLSIHAYDSCCTHTLHASTVSVKNLRVLRNLHLHHYFLYFPVSNTRDEKICDIQGLHCLSKHKDVLFKLQDKDGKRINCGCYPLCDDVNYVLQSNALQEWFLGTNLQWGMVTYPRMRYRRDIIFGFTDVLVAVGGMAGLFLGCSVLSFMEIVYFITLRLFCYAYTSK
ncbi:uncharacterized protein LOC113501419 [Trichoplusia ni]|uniref:Uncharacterized protein LOC113501419 n=1 Tax=Trichoplusia ni TaxID=7111 RepID=A0A7E5WCH4_TRINI|nr:uncharacterized protein LOC113501419 [Trichoplusia ni]